MHSTRFRRRIRDLFLMKIAENFYRKLAVTFMAISYPT